MIKLSQRAKHAVLLGTLCSVSYLAVYIARDILSAVTPQMVADGASTEAYIGEISSLYFIFYAVGQLINGAIGDKIKAKYMMGLGLLLAGVTTFIFPLIIEHPKGAMIVYGMTGFFLSMIYGPMTKVVSENTEPVHATRCSLGYTFASFVASPVAGLLAIFLIWQSVFYVSSLILVAMAVTCFIVFTVFERKGIIAYGNYKPQHKGVGNVKILFKHQIVKYSFISIITGIVRTSVVFWLPTYISQYLEFSPQVSVSIFSVASLTMSFTTFIAVFLYERLGHDMDKTVLIMFIVATLFFAFTFLVKLPVINIICIVIAIMGANGAASMLWSKYCPSLRDTGMVSSATGFLDFLSYMAAAVANLVFANAITDIGWGNLILVWTALMAFGVVISLPYGKILKKKTNQI